MRSLKIGKLEGKRSRNGSFRISKSYETGNRIQISEAFVRGNPQLLPLLWRNDHDARAVVMCTHWLTGYNTHARTHQGFGTISDVWAGCGTPLYSLTDRDFFWQNKRHRQSIVAWEKSRAGYSTFFFSSSFSIGARHFSADAFSLSKLRFLPISHMRMLLPLFLGAGSWANKLNMLEDKSGRNRCWRLL